MDAALVEYAKGWGYEVTLPGEREPVEVSEAEVDAEFARRLARKQVRRGEADRVKRWIAEEIARARRGSA